MSNKQNILMNDVQIFPYPHLEYGSVAYGFAWEAITQWMLANVFTGLQGYQEWSSGPKSTDFPSAGNNLSQPTPRERQLKQHHLHSHTQAPPTRHLASAANSSANMPSLWRAARDRATAAQWETPHPITTTITKSNSNPVISRKRFLNTDGS